MIYTAIDNFYLTDEQLQSSPSRKDGIDEEIETNLRIYGCDLIQESGILLRLPQAVMATGQVLFHRFFCKKSFVRFSVRRVAASCVWLASKLEESPRRAKNVILVFHRMECRRENLPIEHFDIFSKKYMDLKNDLVRNERHLLKEMGFICHVEHPHKFISNYLATLEAPPELRQEAWNLANDSLRTTLCVRYKSEVIACGVVYAAARRFRVALPEDPPWWTVFDADETGIQEVCRVLAHLYSLPKAKYIAVYKENDSYASYCKTFEAAIPKESLANGHSKDSGTSVGQSKDTGFAKDAVIKAALEKIKEGKNDNSRALLGEETSLRKSKSETLDAIVDKARERDRDKFRGRDSDHGRGARDSDRDKEHEERENERKHRSKQRSSGHSDRMRRHSSRERDRHTSHSSRERDGHRHRQRT